MRYIYVDICKTRECNGVFKWQNENHGHACFSICHVEPVLEDVVSKWQNEIHDVYNLKASFSNVYSSVS